ncbi:ABC transporter ATP-binding protein [Lancefieldella rimae]
MKTVIHLIKECLDGQKVRYFICLLLGILIQVISFAQPQLGGRLIDLAATGGEMIPVVVIMITLLLLNGVLSILQQINMGRAGEDVAGNLREKLAKKIFSLPILEYELHPAGWYSQRLIADIDLVKGFPERLIRITQSVLMLIGSFIALVVIDCWTFIVGLILGCIALCFTALASRPVKEQINEVQDYLTVIATKLENFSFANRLLNSYNAWSAACNDLISCIDSVRTAGIKKTDTLSLFSPISSMLMQIADMGVIVLGSYRVAEGNITFSSLVVFLMYFSFFSSAINQIATSIQQLRSTEVGSNRIKECLSWPSKPVKERWPLERKWQPNVSRTSSEPMEVCFKNVTYSYPNRQKPILRNISFFVPKGMITALVGQSGGGKTTCFSLIEGFFNSYDGTITIDGVDLLDQSIDCIRDDIAYIDQDSTAERGSIRKNLALANPMATENDMKSALKIVGMDIYSNQLDYDVGERGSSLSGGQRQKLSLARAIIKAPRLLLMDEPTANLDGISEKEFFDLLIQNFPCTTILYSAHRASMITRADWIIVIRDGRVVAEGSHNLLMEHCPYYRKLVTSQSTTH